MTAIDFLDLLAKQFKQNGLHVSANLLRFVLDRLYDNDTDGALQSLRDSRDFLLGEMRKGHYETERYAAILALLNTVENMLEVRVTNG